MKETSLEWTLRDALAWVNRLHAEARAVVGDLDNQLGALKTEQWMNVKHVRHDLMKQKTAAMATLAELTETRDGIIASLHRFQRSRLCWPDKKRRAA